MKHSVKVSLFTEFNGGEDSLDLQPVTVQVSDKQLRFLLELEQKINDMNFDSMKPNEGIWLSVVEEEQ